MDFMKTIKTITINGEKIQYDKIVITDYIYLYIDHNVEVAKICYNDTLDDLVWIMELLRDDAANELIWEKLEEKGEDEFVEGSNIMHYTKYDVFRKKGEDEVVE